jgi:hypothetical protein
MAMKVLWTLAIAKGDGQIDEAPCHIRVGADAMTVRAVPVMPAVVVMLSPPVVGRARQT